MKTLLCATMMLFYSCTQVQTTPDRAAINEVCKRFMKAFADARYNDAFMALKSNTAIEDSTIDALQSTAQKQMESVIKKYGKALSYEFVEERTVKDFIAKRVYVLKFDTYYITFSFVLYKGDKKWMINKFDYAEGSDQLL